MLAAYRGRILHCLSEPGEEPAGSYEYLEDGLLLVRDGHIEATAPAAQLQHLAQDIPVTDYSGHWIVPGFIDCHVHYPQLDIIAAHGEQLLDWLQSYTYPAESQFGDPEHAAEAAAFFLDELLRQGTTTALVFATVHPESVDAIFAAAGARNMRLIAGKVLMDRNCPAPLRDTPDSGYTQSREAIERWHGQGRLQYAITPRFAPTSSDRQLERAGRLAAEYPQTHIHTHLAETRRETEWVAELFPQRDSYLDVYDHFGLVRERSVFAHCLQMADDEVQRMAAAGAAMAFCPSSNLFLGSGLFDLARARRQNVRVGLGTDVGAGTSLSLLRTIGDAYKVGQLKNQHLTPWRAFYLMTLGGAEALYLDDKLGNFAPGKEADFVVIDDAATPLSARRCGAAGSYWERMFATMILGDDRMIRDVFVAGKRVSGAR